MPAPFHLAIPVHDLGAARSFYGRLFGCPEGRSSAEWVDFDFFGHQLVTHLDPTRRALHFNDVDGKDVPVPHFGVVLEWEDWHELAARLRGSGTRFVIEPGIRFRGEVGEQATFFLYDPSGIDANGRSFFAEDGVSPAMLTLAARPDYRNNNIWRTVGSPAPLDAADSVLEQRGVLPPQSGTVIRVIDIPPEEKDPELRKRQTEAVFAAQFADAKHDSSHARHPGMHVTDTIDYAIVLHGELVAIMDAGETVMRAGDILIQRGTNHAWANRSGAVARIAFILVDGRR